MQISNTCMYNMYIYMYTLYTCIHYIHVCIYVNMPVFIFLKVLEILIFFEEEIKEEYQITGGKGQSGSFQ